MKSRGANCMFIVMTRKLEYRVVHRLKVLDLIHVKIAIKQSAKLDALHWPYYQKYKIIFPHGISTTTPPGISLR